MRGLMYAAVEPKPLGVEDVKPVPVPPTLKNNTVVCHTPSAADVPTLLCTTAKDVVPSSKYACTPAYTLPVPETLRHLYVMRIKSSVTLVLLLLRATT